MYHVTIRPKAKKMLDRIDDPYYSKIKAAIISLSQDPRPHGYKKLRGRDSYRIRVGDYRVIYEISDHFLFVEVINLGHRSDIYGQ